MSSFKNFAPMLSSLQDQADGKGTIAGSPLEDFLSIAGYETPGGGGGGGFTVWHVTVNSVAKEYGEISAEYSADFDDTPYKMLTLPYINGVAYYSYTVGMGDGVTDFDFGFLALDESGAAVIFVGSGSNSGLTYSVTGSITVEEDGDNWIFRITGDGTITITEDEV